MRLANMLSSREAVKVSRTCQQWTLSWDRRVLSAWQLRGSVATTSAPRLPRKPVRVTSARARTLPTRCRQHETRPSVCRPGRRQNRLTTREKCPGSVGPGARKERKGDGSGAQRVQRLSHALAGP